MAKTIKFEDFGKSNKTDKSRNPQCRACEDMLADALDDALTPPDEAWFDGHMASCVACSEMVSDAKRGAAWLEMLKTPRPEPSAMLVERILAETSGTYGVDADDLGAEFGANPLLPLPFPLQMPLPVVPAAGVRVGGGQVWGGQVWGGRVWGTQVLPFRPRMPRTSGFDPRLAMTAAMAFFSIALTLNLSGVRLNELNANNLKAANLKRTYYEANAQAIRFYDGLRVVRVLESRVDDLREATAGREATGGGDSPRGRDTAPSPDSPHGPPEQKTPKPDAGAKSDPDKKSAPGKGMSFEQPLQVLPNPVNETPDTTRLFRQAAVRPEGGLA